MIIKLTGTQSVLKLSFQYNFLNDDFHVALVSFHATNLIPNVTNKNNILYLGDAEYSIPVGQYTIDSMKNYLQRTYKINIKDDEVKNRITFEDNKLINYEKDNNLCKFLGYPDSVPKFMAVDTFNVHCNIASGQIVGDENGLHKETDIISTFKVKSYFKEPMIYECRTPIYFPVQHARISTIEVKIMNENNELIDFGGALITVMLEIKGL